MSLAGAPNVALPASPRWAEIAAADMVSQTAKCMRQFAPPAAKILPYRSSPAETDRFIAEIATNRSPAETAGKSQIAAKTTPRYSGEFFLHQVFQFIVSYLCWLNLAAEVSDGIGQSLR